MLNIYNRRYIGNKTKLNEKISKIFKEIGGESLLDLFAGTGTVAFNNLNQFKKIGVNDFLYHNYVIYNAFFSNIEVDRNLINNFINKINELKYKENLFSRLYGGKFYTKEDASKIWEARKLVEKMKKNINLREYYVLISIIIFAADKSAKTVGHFESFLKKGKFKKILFKKIDIKSFSNDFILTNEDSNELINKHRNNYDVIYIDPPYNSRQYAYFYHILETIALFKLNDETIFSGVANKPDYIYKKTSNYSKSVAKKSFSELIKNIDAKYIVVSYNNTFAPSSTSSKNKISYDEIISILEKKGSLKIKKIKHAYFNAGKTNFNNHAEFLFIVEVKND